MSTSKCALVLKQVSGVFSRVTFAAKKKELRLRVTKRKNIKKEKREDKLQNEKEYSFRTLPYVAQMSTRAASACHCAR